MFMIFCKLNELIQIKSHLTINGFLECVAIANQLNRPFTIDELNEFSLLGKIPNISTFNYQSFLNINPN
jgi:hypothetical protein